MDVVLADALRRWRNAYRYPRAHITETPSLLSKPIGVDLGHGIFGQLHDAAAGAVTDVDLDAYHNGLLLSGKTDKIYFGCASIIYLGVHYTKSGLCESRSIKVLRESTGCRSIGHISRAD